MRDTSPLVTSRKAVRAHTSCSDSERAFGDLQRAALSSEEDDGSDGSTRPLGLGTVRA